jgi:hypothetical protein
LRFLEQVLDVLHELIVVEGYADCLLQLLKLIVFEEEIVAFLC